MGAGRMFQRHTQGFDPAGEGRLRHLTMTMVTSIEKRLSQSLSVFDFWSFSGLFGSKWFYYFLLLLFSMYLPPFAHISILYLQMHACLPHNNALWMVSTYYIFYATFIVNINISSWWHNFTLHIGTYRYNILLSGSRSWKTNSNIGPCTRSLTSAETNHHIK